MTTKSLALLITALLAFGAAAPLALAATVAPAASASAASAQQIP